MVGAKSSRGVGRVSIGTTLDVAPVNLPAASSSMTSASPREKMGSSSPSTVSWLYLRRMSLRVTPLRTSSWRSSLALAYSAACHSGGVSSGMPASSQRTYARMPMRSSGTTIWETSTMRSPSAVWPACARVTVAMDRLAAAGRVAPRSAEAPRTVLLEPAATNFGAPTTLAPPIAVAAIVAPDAERGDAGLELRARLEGSSRSV
mmetsp:Transcript_3621/g.15908  ORF Transcript_3621/g.15908 Transcript_3621/m.15908 type:complete len:204 (-) Transcript_3621:38-649(-)